MRCQACHRPGEAQSWEEMHTGFFDLAVPIDEDHQKLFVPRG